MRGRGEGERNSSLIFGYCLYQYGKLESAAISVLLHQEAIIDGLLFTCNMAVKGVAL